MRLRARFSMSECVTPESVVSSRESRRLANLLDVRRIYRGFNGLMSDFI